MLKLNERYRRMGLQHLGSLYPPLRRAYGSDHNAQRVSEELGTYADDHEMVHGVNYWLAVLYRSLSSTNAFCDGGFGMLANCNSLQNNPRRGVNFGRRLGVIFQRLLTAYAPYSPAMMEKYLTIFRTVDNFVFKGDDGKTPAMRLDFTKAPLEYEDILWPQQRVTRPKAVRRRGKKAVAA